MEIDTFGLTAIYFVLQCKKLLQMKMDLGDDSVSKVHTVQAFKPELEFPSTQGKKLGVVVLICNSSPRDWGQGMGCENNRGIPGAHWPATFTESVCSRFSEKRSCLKKFKWRAVKKVTQHCSLASTYICTHIYTQIQMKIKISGIL